MKIIILTILLLTGTTQMYASLGNWLMYIGNNAITSNISLWNEIQYRDYTFAGDMNQLLMRSGINYIANEQSQYMIGYAYILTSPLDDSFTFMQNSYKLFSLKDEHRIFQQALFKQQSNTHVLQHRFRLEQRYIKDQDLQFRLRYFVSDMFSFTKQQLQEKNAYGSVYSEVFLNLQGSTFDRLRLYGALGYQWSKHIRTECGFMTQILPNEMHNQLQFAIFTSAPWF
jgi:hypothetical protein